MIRPFASKDAELDFVCARGPEQVAFWKTKAALAHEHNSARIYVLEGEGLVPIQGFYAICMARIQLTDLPELRDHPLPEQCPAALLAQLARDDRAPKLTGVALLGDAIERVVRIAENIGCVGIILDAKNTDLIKYYERLGFSSVGTRKRQTQRMFMHLRDAQRSLGAAYGS